MTERDVIPALPLLWAYNLIVAALTPETSWRTALLRQLTPRASDVIADVGCGTAPMDPDARRRAGWQGEPGQDLSSTSCAESLPVGGRRNPEAANEGPPHPLFVAEPARVGDLLDPGVAALERPARRFDAKIFDQLGRRPTVPEGEVAGERPRRHADRFREVVDAEIRAQVAQDPCGQLGEPRAGVPRIEARLCGECAAELRLAAGAVQEDHESLAIARLTRRPWSASTSASARSIPAVMPAEVQIGPSTR